MIINEIQTTSHRFGLYEDGKIAVNKNTYSHSIWLEPNAVHSFEPKLAENIQGDDFKDIIELDPDIVIIGTGPKHRLLRSEQILLLTQNGIGVEVMSTKAAIRSYMILTQDSRHVIACLIV